MLFSYSIMHMNFYNHTKSLK